MMNISSAELIAANVDILSQILICLPARSLLVFRCVSRQWLSLISDPRFQHNHFLRNANPSTSGLYYKADSRHLRNYLPISLLRGSYRSLPPLTFLIQIGSTHPLFDGREICIHHAFNGLILCSVRMVSDRTPRLIVCNPTTQRCKLVHTVDEFPWELSVRPFLYFDPSISTHYKVIIVRQFLRDWPEGIYDFGIYSSESESWKTMRLTGPPVPLLAQCRLVSSDGVIHFISKSARRFHVQFTVHSEELSYSPMIEEPVISGRYRIVYFGENGARLFLVVHCSSRELMIYEMDKREGSDSHWIVMQHFDLTQVLSEGCCGCGFVVLCATFQRASGSDLDLVLAVPGKVIYYNHRSEVMEVLCDLPSGYLRLCLQAMPRCSPIVSLIASSLSKLCLWYVSQGGKKFRLALYLAINLNIYQHF